MLGLSEVLQVSRHHGMIGSDQKSAFMLWQLRKSLTVQIRSSPARRTRRSLMCSQCLRQSGLSASPQGVNRCWRRVVHSPVGRPIRGLSWKARSVLTVRAGWGAGGGGGARGIITKHAADCSGTKAALTSSLLVASEGRSRSALTRLTRTTSHHSWGAETSCSITRHETDFFQLQWTGHKPRLTTSSAQTEQGEDGWARTEDKSGIGVEGVRVGRGRKSTL